MVTNTETIDLKVTINDDKSNTKNGPEKITIKIIFVENKNQENQEKIN
jgi:hypothetical protein